MQGKHIVLLSIGIITTVLIVRYRRRIRKGISKAVDVALSGRQEAYIKELNPAVRENFRKFITEVQKKTGWGVYPTSAYRSFSKQADLNKENPKNARPGYSSHNFGTALDINAFRGGKWLKKASPKREWEKTGIPKIAENYGLAWGGNFTSYYDPVHFYEKKYTTTSMRQLALKQFGDDISKIKGNQVRLVA